MDFLIDNQFFDYPMTEIARESNVSYNSLKLFFPNLIKSGILYKTRKMEQSIGSLWKRKVNIISKLIISRKTVRFF